MPVKTILWSILVLSTCGRVFRCNYRGVYSGSGHYDYLIDTLLKTPRFKQPELAKVR
jgi:hypothetical protein